MQHISLIDQVLRPIDSLRFNRKMSKIYLDFDWSTAEIGSYLIFECFRILDPEEYVSIYNDRMLKKLVTAKIKYQWGQNIQKFQGIQLLGGVTVDGTTIMAQAVAEISAAEDEIKSVYSTPAVGFIG
jgi:2-phosphoglycerate kinase